MCFRQRCLTAGDGAPTGGRGRPEAARVGVVTRIHSSAAARTLRALVAACGVAMIVAAGGLLLQWRQVDGAAQRYLDSPCTQHPVAGACAGVGAFGLAGLWPSPPHPPCTPRAPVRR